MFYFSKFLVDEEKNEFLIVVSLFDMFFKLYVVKLFVDDKVFFVWFLILLRVGYRVVCVVIL